MIDREIVSNEVSTFTEEDRQFVEQLIAEYKQNLDNLHLVIRKKYKVKDISKQISDSERDALRQQLREHLHQRFGDNEIEAVFTLCSNQDYPDVATFGHHHRLFDLEEIQPHHMRALCELLQRFISESSRNSYGNVLYFTEDFYKSIERWIETKEEKIDPETIYIPFRAFIEFFQKEKIDYELLRKHVINFVTLLLKNNWQITPQVSKFLQQMKNKARAERQPEINLYLQTLSSVQEGSLESKHLPDANDFDTLERANTFTVEKLSGPPYLNVNWDEFDFNSVSGIYCSYLRLQEPIILQVGNETIHMEASEPYIEVHFSPFGLQNFDHLNPVHNELQPKVLTAGSIGALQLIEALKEFPFSMDTPVVGWTNPTMADFGEKYLGLQKATRTNSNQKKFQYLFSTVRQLEASLHDNMHTFFKIAERAQRRTRA
jgi:hypothetical protein